MKSAEPQGYPEFRGPSNGTSILIGAAMISLAILISGGVIKLNGLPLSGKSTTTTTPSVDRVENITKNLKTTATGVGLDINQFSDCLDSSKTASLVKADLDDGNKFKVTGTPAFFLNGKFISGAQPYQVFKDTIEYELKGGDWNNPGQLVSYLFDGDYTNYELAKTNFTKPVEVGLGNLPPLGKADAKVVLIEFSDYECPFCERHYTQTEQQLVKDYINTGKVRLYYRDYPISGIHPGAQKAAEAARCAGEQGKYWEFHDKVFENQGAIFK